MVDKQDYKERLREELCAMTQPCFFTDLGRRVFGMASDDPSSDELTPKILGSTFKRVESEG